MCQPTSNVFNILEEKFMITAEIRRVFYHEFGHFIAIEINHQFYHGPGTKSIQLFHDLKDRNKWGGDTKVNLSEDGIERLEPAKEKLPEYFANLVYGCFVETYFIKEDFDTCFKTHGLNDTKQWHSILRHYDIDDYNVEISSMEKKFFEYLVDQKSFESFIQLQPDNYLERQGTGYTVDIIKLRRDTAVFLESHLDDYNRLVKEYSEIFDKIFSEKTSY
jgi:hypothetical protein